MSGNGRQRCAEQARQLQGGIVRRVVHAIGAQRHTGHDGDDVEGVLAEGGEAHDGEDSAQCGAVEISAHQQHIRNAEQAVDAHVHQNGARAEHTQIVAGRPSGGGQQPPVSGPDRPGRHSGGRQADDDHGHAHQSDDQHKRLIVLLRPVQHGVRLIAEGRQHRHDHHGQQAAGESHVIEIHAVLNLICIAGQGREDKSNHKSRQHAQRDARMDAAKGHVADQRRQRRGQQRHGGILGKGLPLVAGIQPGPQDDGPDVEQVLSEQGKSRHQSHFHDRKAVIRVPGEANDADGHQRHRAGVNECGPWPRYIHVVRDQQILHGDDAVESGKHIGRVSHQKPQRHQSQ